MNRKEKKIIRRRLLRSYVCSVISISLVLFLVGFFSLLAVGASRVSAYFKENIKLSAILTDEVTEEAAFQLSTDITLMPPVRAVTVISRDEGTAQMQQMLGEDFLEVFESNPVPVSIDIQLKQEYFHPDSVAAFRDSLQRMETVADVVYQDSLIRTINKNMRRIGAVMIVFIGLLMFISIVLINNTVRLNIFSRRFSIHTMQLVGATRGFIQRPFLYHSVYQGILSGIVAIAALGGVLLLAKRHFVTLFELIDMETVLLLAAALLVLGVLICLVCTLFVVRRMIGMDVNDLYY